MKVFEYVASTTLLNMYYDLQKVKFLSNGQPFPNIQHAMSKYRLKRAISDGY